jgi:hypothetical protein
MVPSSASRRCISASVRSNENRSRFSSMRFTLVVHGMTACECEGGLVATRGVCVCVCGCV